MKGLRATVKRLEGQLHNKTVGKREEQFRALQQDLKEADRIRTYLQNALKDELGWTDVKIEGDLDKKVLGSGERLYGSSREGLLRENKDLRATLDQHHITTRTSANPPGYPRGLAPPSPPTKTVAVTQNYRSLPSGPHAASVVSLLHAAEALRAAEGGYSLPHVAHAEAQADDGSLGFIAMLEAQVAALAGQKANLLHKISDLEAAAGVSQRKLQLVEDQATEARRQKTELLLHQDHLSLDLRNHLAAESARADSAELMVAESKVQMEVTHQQSVHAMDQMGMLSQDVAALQAALHEKTEQVVLLRGLYDDLREAVRSVGEQHDDTGARVLLALQQLHSDQSSALAGAVAVVAETHQVTEASARQSNAAAMQQQALAGELRSSTTTAAEALRSLDAQLTVTHRQLAQAQIERRQVQRQIVAGNLLGRLEDRKHAAALLAVRSDMPDAVADRLAGDMQGLVQSTHEVGLDVQLANAQLSALGMAPHSAGGAAEPGGGPGGEVLDLRYCDPADDTMKLLGNAQHLRAQLQTLMSLDAHAGPELHAGAPPRLLPSGTSRAALVTRPLFPAAGASVATPAGKANITTTASIFHDDAEGQGQAQGQAEGQGQQTQKGQGQQGPGQGKPQQHQGQGQQQPLGESREWMSPVGPRFSNTQPWQGATPGQQLPVGTMQASTTMQGSWGPGYGGPDTRHYTSDQSPRTGRAPGSWADHDTSVKSDMHDKSDKSDMSEAASETLFAEANGPWSKGLRSQLTVMSPVKDLGRAQTHAAPPSVPPDPRPGSRFNRPPISHPAAPPPNSQLGRASAHTTCDSTPRTTTHCPQNASQGPGGWLAEFPEYPQNAQQVPQDAQRVPQNAQRVPQNAQQIPQDAQWVPQNAQGAPQNAQRVPQNVQRGPQDAPRVPQNVQHPFSDVSNPSSLTAASAATAKATAHYRHNAQQSLRDAMRGHGSALRGPGNAPQGFRDAPARTLALPMMPPRIRPASALDQDSCPALARAMALADRCSVGGIGHGSDISPQASTEFSAEFLQEVMPVPHPFFSTLGLLISSTASLQEVKGSQEELFADVRVK